MADRAFYKSQAGKRTYKKVTVDGVDHWVRSLLSPEKTAAELKFRDKSGKLIDDNAAEKKLAMERAMSIVDGDLGQLVFGSPDGTFSDEDIETCRNLPHLLAGAIDSAIMELNYLPADNLAKN